MLRTFGDLKLTAVYACCLDPRVAELDSMRLGASALQTDQELHAK
jgi:hypothetical protein